MQASVTITKMSSAIDGDAFITIAALDCVDLFNRSAKERQPWAEDQLARFNVWATNLGVFATEHASVGYRLRDVPEISKLVMQQLEVLSANLSHRRCKLDLY